MSQNSSIKPLRRSRTDRVFAGICGGFANYLGIDPVAARVLYLVLTFLTGGALILGYLLIWIIMPEEDPAPAWPAPPYPPAATPPSAQPVD
jgi:phage shock protein PspC (stress-responsive transcriptional regulator)